LTVTGVVTAALRAGVITATPAGATGASLFVTRATTVARAAAATRTLGTASTGVAGRAGLLERLELLGREDPGELVFHLLFEVGDLLALVVGEIEFLFGEAGDHVDAAGRAGATGTIATRATTVFARRGRWAVGTIRGAGECDQRRAAHGKRQHQQGETIHRGLLTVERR
jgi:hypothetical protein